MIHLTKKHRYALSILTGVLLVVSFPFTGSLTPLVFISWIPLLFVESYISKKNYRSGKIFLHAFIAFSIYNVGTTWWIWNASLEGALMAFSLNSLFMASVFFLFHLTKKNVGQKEGYLSLLFYWIAFEYFHYHWELSWPWLNLGNSFSIVPSIVQWYSYTGVLGGTFWILLSNLVGFRILDNVFIKREKWLVQTPLIYGFSLLLIVPVSISLFQYFSYSEEKNPVEVVLIQPNIDPYNEKFVATLEEQLKKMCDLADPLVTASTDIVIAPETAISWPFYEEDLLLTTFYPYLKSRQEKWGNPAFYCGASTARYFDKKNSFASRKFSDGPGYYENYNSSLLLEDKEKRTFLHKSKLVLGVEKMPFTDWLPFLEELSIDKGGTSGSLGIEKEVKVLETKEMTFAPVICYESIYGEFNAEQCRKGAQAIFIITNDGWWQDTPGYKQHMSFARLRAIENRRSVARSANTGISCFINQRGDVVKRSKWWEPIALKETINLNNDTTMYTKYGDVIGRSFAFVSALILLLTFTRAFKRIFTR